jgi:hypothetical protein
MRSDDLKPAIIVLALLCVGAYFFFGPSAGPFGNVIGSFTSQANVARVDYEPMPDQVSLAIANGPNVQLIIDAQPYTAIQLNATVRKPAGYETGFAWQETTPQARNISDTGQNLELSLDPAVTQISLLFSVQAPVLATDYVTETEHTYAKGVHVGSESHLVNVSASTAVSPDFSGYRLYEVGSNETDKTEEYHLQVSNGIARWYGFNLSAKTFKLVSTNGTGRITPPPALPGNPTSEGGHGGGSHMGCYVGWHNEGGRCVRDAAKNSTASQESPLPPVQEQPQELQRYTVDPQWVTLALSENESRIVNITLRSRADAPLNITYYGTTEFLGKQQRSLTLQSGEEMQIPVTIGPLTPGEWLGRIITSDGTSEQQVFFQVEGAGTPPQQESPAQTPGPDTSWDLLIVLLIVIGVFIFLFLHPKQSNGSSP